LIEAELLWDDASIEHIWERHHLRIEEVDEAFHSLMPLFIQEGMDARWFTDRQKEGDT
jgi:hypothetical protein